MITKEPSLSHSTNKVDNLNHSLNMSNDTKGDSLFILTDNRIASATFMGILFFTAVFGNLLVCIAFTRFRQMRSLTNYYVFSLAISDIMVGLICIPIWLSIEVTGWANDKLFVFVEAVDIAAGVASILNLTAISIDRSISILFPLRYKCFMTKHKVKNSILVLWMFSLGLASLRLLDFKHYIILVSSIGFGIPFLIMFVAYMLILRKLYSRKTTQPRNPLVVDNWKVARMLMIVTFVFSLCWIPFFTVSLLYHYCTDCNFSVVNLTVLISFVKWLHYFNSTLNPCVYGVFSPRFRRAFKVILQGGSYNDFLQSTSEQNEPICPNSECPNDLKNEESVICDREL